MTDSQIISAVLPAHTVAAIDIGTNQIRIVIADIQSDGRFQVIEQLQQAVNLGQDTFTRGRLSPASIRSTVSILRDFRQILELYHVQHVRTVATTAVREAANSDTLLDRIFMATGLDVSILEAPEESRLTVSAIRYELGDLIADPSCTSLIVDVGGGSTLLSLLLGPEILASQSLPLGAIRMQEALQTCHETPRRAAQIIKTRIAHEIEVAGRQLLPARIGLLIAMGSNIGLVGRERGAPQEPPGIYRLESADLDRFIKQSQALSPDELARQYGLSYSQAETLNPALLIYQALARTTRPRQILVCHSSLRDGLLLDMASQVTGREDIALTHGAIHSAHSVAEKYQTDLNHALNVETLALSLFDQLKTDLGLQSRHRLLLRLAAILHEIGKFVSNRSHHKHSYYLIANTELFGVSRDDLINIALISRYHRRSCPKPAHTDYIILGRERRMIISKLAGLLRLADALDVTHRQPIHSIRCERAGDELILYTPDARDLTLERRALALKSDLYSDLTGLRVRLESAIQHHPTALDDH